MMEIRKDGERITISASGCNESGGGLSSIFNGEKHKT